MSAALPPAPRSPAPAVRETTFHGLPALQLGLPSGDVAVVAVQGAQVLSWVPAGAEERLYLSPRAVFDGHSAIRGGTPVCFPQFNQRGPLAKHGFVRNLPWQRDEAATPPEATASGVSAVLVLRDSAQTREWWPHGFTARLVVTLTEGGLRTELTAQNTGDSAWDFTMALHSYLRIPDIAQARLEGLDGCARWDAVADVRGTQQGAVTFEGEYDSVFTAPGHALQLHGGGAGPLRIEQSSSCANTVVWNPGAALCARLADMPADGFRHMVCVEAAAIDQPVTLAPGARWTGWQQLRLA